MKSEVGCEPSVSSEKIQIVFGAFGPSLTEQLASFNVDAEELETIELLSHSVAVCKIHALISEAATNSAYKRIMKRIEREILKARKRLTANQVPSGGSQ